MKSENKLQDVNSELIEKSYPFTTKPQREMGNTGKFYVRSRRRTKITQINENPNSAKEDL